MKFTLIVALFAFCFGVPQFGNAQDIPPGTVHLQGDIYVDQYEIRNVDYREFLYWYLRKFDAASIEYKMLLPDSTVWIDNPNMPEDYSFTNSKYKEYPVVGLSWQQAMAYTKWRSDRVNEQYYVQKGMLEMDDADGLRSLPVVYAYRLPKIAELQALSEIEYKDREKVLLAELPKSIQSVAVGPKNKLKLYGVHSNVSEMTRAPNLAMGTNWLAENDNIEKRYTKPECWLGFRCICTVQKPEEK